MTPRPTLLVYSSNPAVDTLAKRLGFKNTKAYRFAIAHGLAFKLGHSVHVDPAELEALIPKLRVAPKKTAAEKQADRIKARKAMRAIGEEVRREVWRRNGSA
jgi:hypothetical protein